MEKVKDDLRKVINGELEGPEVGMSETRINVPRLANISKTSLQAEQYRLSLLIAAAWKLRFGTLEQTARLSLQFLSVLAYWFHNLNLTPLTVSSEDLAETALSLISEIEENEFFQPATAKAHVQEEPGAEPRKEHQSKIVDSTSPEEYKNTDSDKEGKGQESVEEMTADIRQEEEEECTTSHEDQGRKPIKRQIKTKKKENKRKETSMKSAQEKRKHYVPRKCPLCKKVVCNLGIHIKRIHVDKNECLPVARIKPLLQMARHGNEIKGGKYTKIRKDGKRRVYKRDKYICARCDSVVVYLSTHLQRVHHLAAGSKDYESSMLFSRRYDGKTRELEWDEGLIHRKRKTIQRPTKSKHSKREEDTEIEEVAYVHPLTILAQELSSDSSDESFDVLPREVPPTPLKTTGSFMGSAARKARVQEGAEGGVKAGDDDDGGAEVVSEEEMGGLDDDGGAELVCEEEMGGLDDDGVNKLSCSDRDEDEGSAEESDVKGSVGKDTSGKESADEESSDDDESSDYDRSSDDKSSDDDKTSDDDKSSDDEESDVPTSNEDDKEESGSSSEESTASKGVKENFKTWKEYYEKGKGTNPMETLLVKYYHYLRDIMGGCKKESQAVEHAQNVRRVRDKINSKDKSLGCFVEDGGLNIWRKWAKPLLDARKARPGTIRASLTSLNKFFEFILDQTENKVKDFPRIDSDTIEAIKRLIKRVVAMASSVNQLYCHEHWEHVLEENMNAINPEDTMAMVDTPPAQKALSLLIKSSASKLSVEEALSVRDFLIARITLENGQRPGPLETARLRDFERIQEKQGKFIMYVTRHKRSKAGPAPITMSANLKTNLEAYIRNVRGILAKQGENAIFLTKEGVGFQEGTIGKRITSWWRKATGKTNVTSTRLRKMHSSHLYNRDDRAKRSAHTLMCHSSRTAEKHYMINRLADAAVEGHRVLTENMQLKETLMTPIVQSTPCVTNEDESPGKDFSNEQYDDIDLLFGHVVKTNAPLTMQQTRNVMSESLNLAHLVKDAQMVGKVYRRVKFLQDKQWKESIQEVQEEDTMSRTAEWAVSTTRTSSRGKRFQWCDEDVEEITKAFADFQTCPAKAVILEAFRSNTNLQDIAQRNGTDRCYEKVKTIFKKRSG